MTAIVDDIDSPTLSLAFWGIDGSVSFAGFGAVVSIGLGSF